MRLRKVSVSARISYFEESFRGAASQGIDPQVIREPKRYNAVESFTEEMAKNQTQKSDIECKFFENASDVPDPRELSPDKKNLMVFDDLLLERQNKCEAYYTRGRHSNVDCFYLAQNYFKLPRQTIKRKCKLYLLVSSRSKER